jgi:hypothetical protein
MRAAVHASRMKCPSCDSTRVFPSRLRGFLEKLRQRLTDQQPYRCHECGWRKWRPIDFLTHSPDVRPDDLRTGRQPGPIAGGDLDPLDPKFPG